MKKLLYTLMVGLAIVACDKEDMDNGMSSSSINTIEQSTNDESVGLSDQSINAIDRLISSSKSLKNSVSTSKDEVASAGTYIQIVSVTDETGFFEFVFDDEQDVCLDSNHSFDDAAYAILNSDGGIGVATTSDGTPLLTLDGSYEYLFNIDFFKGSRINFDGTSSSGTVSGTQIIFN